MKVLTHSTPFAPLSVMTIISCLVLSSMIGCVPSEPKLNTRAPDYGFPDSFDTDPSAEAGEITGPQLRDLGMPNSTWPVMSGYWRVDHRTTLRSELPVLLEEVDTTIDAILLAEITQEEGRLWLHYEMCDVRMENTPAYNHTLLPDSFLAALPYRTRRAELKPISEGWQLIVPRQYELRGVSMEQPALDPFPIDDGDLRIFDQDRDGLPGLTARLVGFPEGEVNLIQRSWDEWNGQVNVDENRGLVTSVSGGIHWGDEQTIIRATNDVLLVEVNRWIPEDLSLHQFTMQRVDELVCPPRRAAPVPDI